MDSLESVQEVVPERVFYFNMLAQKHLEINKDNMYVCFIDYAKVFDRVKHLQLIVNRIPQ